MEKIRLWDHKDCLDGETVLCWILTKRFFKENIGWKTKRLGEKQMQDGKMRYPVFVRVSEIRGCFSCDEIEVIR